MRPSITIAENETNAAKAFSRQSAVFDNLYGTDAIIRYKRERVRQHVEQLLTPAASILELNAGTGEDALYFAQKGYSVHATDISEDMLLQLRAKKQQAGIGECLSSEPCDFTRLGDLERRGPYDHIFSNFAGLNCTQRLEKVLQDLPPLLKPGGTISLVILPKFCLWEFMLLFRGRFRTAFRRFSGTKGASARVEGTYFRCWYYNPSFVVRALPEFEVMNIEGLCTLVPPSYLEGFAEKYPGLFGSLCRMESKWKSSWPWRLIGDYYIISLRKRS
ncbi:MAG: class I SAM-dependent methyltransferase [Chitinophagaceae bacterium]|nr:class I SAM-dependent methyltransferase [Chitinophagaceae bacterium]